MRQLHRPARARWTVLALPIVGAVVAAGAACYPTGVDSITDYNTVTTAYKQGYDFAALSTYSVPGATPANPGNCVIKDLSDGGTVVNSANASTICTTVINQFNALGYTLVADGLSGNNVPPSFVVTLGFISQQYTAWVSYPWYGYWGGYYPGYPWGGWGIYYPYYTYAYSYKVGTILIDMDVPDAGAMEGEWGAALNGLQASPNNTPAVIQSYIVQAFTQSPYLGK